MSRERPDFKVKVAQSRAERTAAQRLRYHVFVKELGAEGPLVDHAQQIEADRYDDHADHLLLIDQNSTDNDGVVGTYRLLSQSNMHAVGHFYSSSEFDLQPLLTSGRRLLELGRSCIAPDYRGGTAMFELWAGLAAYVEEHAIDVLFGVASFHGTDLTNLAHPLSYLHHNHLAPAELRVQAMGAEAREMNVIPQSDLDRRAAMLAMPALIKGYLRLGGYVGQGAWIDHAFNTTDVCMVMDTARLTPRQRAMYSTPRPDPKG